jgi:hypothetical protein
MYAFFRREGLVEKGIIFHWQMVLHFPVKRGVLGISKRWAVLFIVEWNEQLKEN